MINDYQQFNDRNLSEQNVLLVIVYTIQIRACLCEMTKSNSINFFFKMTLFESIQQINQIQLKQITRVNTKLLPQHAWYDTQSRVISSTTLYHHLSVHNHKEVIYSVKVNNP